MKKLILVLIITTFLGCDKEETGDCFQTAGTSISYEMDFPVFTKITIQKNIRLILKYGPTQKVHVKTGENLKPEIYGTIDGDRLIFTNENNCNFVRGYDDAVVTITSPNIVEIRNSSQHTITSLNTLEYPNLYLHVTGDKFKYLPIGDYDITVKCSVLRVWANGTATIKVTGTTDNLNINFSDTDPRFLGRHLIAKNVTVNNTSTNDMHVFATEKIEGHIYRLGDVYCYSKPAIVNVVEHYKGRLIFK
ncbi:MAG: hypothetical protein COB98_04335 [Flavobacteriaceae bacterium]|nr:MAG: hypothetical protein COB98_04335 [Flavobacteriaceae bacterium]